MMTLPNDHVIEAYGLSAQALMKPLQCDLASLAGEVTERFYGYITDQGKTAEIISRLTPERFAWLKQQQAQYLAMLLTDDLSLAAHLDVARKVGRAHAFTDVEIRWLVETYGFYLGEIRKKLQAQMVEVVPREAIMTVVAQRFLQDIDAQASSQKSISADITNAFSQLDQEVMATGNLMDLVRDALEIIGNLPGGISVFFARVDETGVLQIEQSYGDAAEQYHQAMEAGLVPKISIDPACPSGQGPGGQCWRSGKIVLTDTWLDQESLAPWKEVGRSLGFRSNASVPLLGESGQTIALLSLYSHWPGYFSTEGMRGFLNHLQHVLSHGVEKRMHAPVVPMREQQLYRALLSEGRVVMHYQPVISLRDGSLTKIEALARLRHQNGELISPQNFLPALGGDELLRLFELGLFLACQDLCKLQKQGLETQVAINLPAEGLGDPRYEKALFDCLGEYDLTPDRVHLEVLENQDAGERTGLHQAFIQRLKTAGVKVVQDDLGSGHSSLLRLDQYPFDEVKIDQGLVRGALHNPKRAVDFIHHLTRLAHSFETVVTVEGLENEGMIEAAAILGADRGQGYGIARPMPLEQLNVWQNTYKYCVDPRKPKTAIGALAGYMLWDMQLATISERPELAIEFVGAKGVVEQFIHVNHLQDTPLGHLVNRSHELVASSSSRSEAAAILRAQLIKELTEYWLSEVSCAD